MSSFMGMTIDIECPECGRQLHPTLDDVRHERTVRCPAGHEIKLVDSGGGARDLGRSADDLDRTLKRLNRTFKIRF